MGAVVSTAEGYVVKRSIIDNTGPLGPLKRAAATAAESRVMRGSS